jgi:hypothetical protein
MQTAKCKVFLHFGLCSLNFSLSLFVLEPHLGFESMKQPIDRERQLAMLTANGTQSPNSGQALMPRGLNFVETE